MPESTENKNPLSRIKLSNAIYPIIIGLGVVGYMLWKDFDSAIFDIIDFTWQTVAWLLVALFFMFGRDFWYIVRIRILSKNELSWAQAFRIIMLWEFTSAITPSAVGGTSVAIIYVHKEGISVGRSSAMVMLTSFLDEFYFIVMFPILLLIVGKANLFYTPNASDALSASLLTFAIIGYSLKLMWVLILTYGLFINPHGLKWLLMKVFRIGFLRRWSAAIEKVGDDIIHSSLDIRNSNWKFWFKSLGSTFMSWTSRYLVANALIMAFFSVSDHLLLFARQFVMWIMMLVMPTPGGSGFAEYIFSEFCSDLINVPLEMQIVAATLVAALWRMVTYYPYLAIGAIVFPRWLKRHFSKKKV